MKILLHSLTFMSFQIWVISPMEYKRLILDININSHTALVLFDGNVFLL